MMQTQTISINSIFQLYRPVCIAFSRLLVLFFCGLFGLFAYYCLWVIFPYYYNKWQSLPYSLSLLALGLWLLYCSCFNYFMAFLTPPGTTFQNDSLNLERITKVCSKCGNRKPPRAHHCAMCNRCILNMDHHCPWIGNCVGHNNRGYFLMMLTYISVGMIVFVLANYELYEKDENQISFSMFIVAASLGSILTPFCLFHWYLACKGSSTVECLNRQPNISSTVGLNLEVCFGTSSALKIILPLKRDLNWDGIIWPQDDIQEQTMEDV